MTRVLVTLIALCFAFNLYAQDDSDANRKGNEIGFEVFGLVDGQFMLNYERTISDHWSLSLGVGLKSENGLVKLSGLDSPSIETGDLTYSGFKVITEGKYYLNENVNGTLTGFYFGGYIKYSNFSSDLTGTYTNDLDEEFIMDFDADINVISVGFMVGYKLPIGKRFAFDFLIAGPGAGFYNFKLANNNPLPDSFYEDLNEALSQYSIFDFLEGDFNFRADGGKSDFGAISFRYAMKLTYAF